MRNSLKFWGLAAAVVGLGMSMPSCPGQQAMQQQIDSLTSTNVMLTKQVSALHTRLKSVTDEQTQVKQLLGQITAAITAQKGAIEQLNTNLKQLQAAEIARAKAAAASKRLASRRKKPVKKRVKRQ